MSIVSYNNRSLQSVTEAASVPAAMVLLSTQTASSSATISFTSNIDDTYPTYMFKFIDIHPATDNVASESPSLCCEIKWDEVFVTL